MKRYIFIICIFLVPFIAYASETTYFVTLRANEVNARTGPAKRYPIDWVYTKKHYPLEVIDKFEHWRKIRDNDDNISWIHKSLLTRRRFVMITKQEALFYTDPTPFSIPLFKAEKKTIGSVIKCKPAWCMIKVSEDLEGWVSKDEIWGVYPEEIIKK